MPKLEYRGIFARPGWYNYKSGKKHKSYKELKKAAQRQPEIMVTLGHPKNHDGSPRWAVVNDYLGRMIQIANDAKQVIEMVFKPHEEDWDKIPLELQEKLENDMPVAISAAFTCKDMDAEEQEDILYGHAGLLKDTDDPTCPLGTCGINVRMESDNGEISEMRYEQATSTKDTEEEKTEEEAVEKPEFVTKKDFDEFSQKVLEMLATKTEETGVEPVNEETEEEQVPIVEEPTPPQPKPTIEPAQTIPKDTSPVEKEEPNDGLFKTARTFSVEIAGATTKKDKK